MSRFFVISPNVENKGNIDEYLDQMFKKHSIMMGWGQDNSLGKLFVNMKIDDYVVCAQGSNANKRVFLQAESLLEQLKIGPLLGN